MAHFNGNEGTFVPDSLVLGAWEARKITIKAGSGKLKRGHVLGQIDEAGAHKGKFVVSAAAATDGSEEPDRILSADVDASGASDVEAVAFIAGTFDQSKLTLGAGHTLASIEKPFRLRNITLENPLG